MNPTTTICPPAAVFCCCENGTVKDLFALVCRFLLFMQLYTQIFYYILFVVLTGKLQPWLLLPVLLFFFFSSSSWSCETFSLFQVGGQGPTLHNCVVRVCLCDHGTVRTERNTRRCTTDEVTKKKKESYEQSSQAGLQPTAHLCIMKGTGWIR